MSKLRGLTYGGRRKYCSYLLGTWLLTQACGHANNEDHGEFAGKHALGVPDDSASVSVEFVRADSGVSPRVLYHNRSRTLTFSTLVTLPAKPDYSIVKVGRTRYAVLLTLNDSDFKGGIVLAVDSTGARPFYDRWSPDGGVCAPPRVVHLHGRDVLVEYSAAIFPVSECTSGNDCPWLVPSTWPKLLSLDGPTPRDVSSAYPDFYLQRAEEYTGAEQRVRSGAIIAGQSNSVRARCGPFVADSLAALTRRARAMARPG